MTPHVAPYIESSSYAEMTMSDLDYLAKLGITLTPAKPKPRWSAWRSRIAGWGVVSCAMLYFAAWAALVALAVVLLAEQVWRML
jgi:hypothetical protein